VKTKTTGEICHEIHNWTFSTTNLLTEFRAAVDSLSPGSLISLRSEAEEKYPKLKSSIQTRPGEFFGLVHGWNNDLANLPKKDINAHTGQMILQYGIHYLENISVSQNPEIFLKGMSHFLFIVQRALEGYWRNPVRRIDDIGLEANTFESLFLYNGIPTLGELQDAFLAGRRLVLFPGPQKGECQKVLVKQGYAAFPISENNDLWAQLGEDGETPLWKRVTNGVVSIYIQLSPTQAGTIMDYHLVHELPDGTLVAKLY